MVSTETTPRTLSVRRGGFTMIELLVVIAIIATLVGLLLPAIFGARIKAEIAQAQNDISQISVAIGNWQTSNSSKWLIDHVNMTGSTTGTTDTAGYAWLKSTWPRLVDTNIPTLNLNTGNKCLVYFLMGPNLQGSNKSSSNPLGDGSNSLNSPFLDFPANRIVNGEITDPWKTPYIYFTSRGPSGYRNAQATSGVSPYVEEGTYPTNREKYANSHSFQLISAGPDQEFGPGGFTPNSPTNGQSTSNWTPERNQYQEPNKGFDDVSNFSGGKQLGVK
jgi:prepilin-type N-terminal cleavage/methylation domain-containing protein